MMSSQSPDWRNLPGSSHAEQDVGADPTTAPTLGVVGAAGIPAHAVCQVCGRDPAQSFTVRRHVGMLVIQKFYKASALLCRDHATELVKSWLGKTLVQGWWGVISLFVNIFVVGSDVAQLLKARGMAPPS
jgi:hypothetical protein